ncbi:hypothetical protein D3H55_04910 [Bacillus salacetis]|uniref:Uncharacterized protein n=1 Tax=Bacillus salacetis TaxID=2315464 RepID=A0A3A1R5I6_9BACI|nr:hypothetical protein [Bacillus salacetis]RIW37376.1 hypothetical protein D3H55_04910 [Bacillus salacetis]
MEEAGQWMFLEGWTPFILIILFLTGAIIIMARFSEQKLHYSVCALLGAAAISTFLYSYLQLGGMNAGAGLAFYSVAGIIGVSIGTAITPFVKTRKE